MTSPDLLLNTSRSRIPKLIWSCTPMAVETSEGSLYSTLISTSVSSYFVIVQNRASYPPAASDLREPDFLLRFLLDSSSL